MVQYTIYKASFRTKRGSQRTYVGMTGDAEQRERSLQQCGPHQPAWLKAGCLDFEYEVVVAKVPSKAAALATEALIAAHEWTRNPLQARGGPWVKPTLTAGDLAELRAVSRCITLQQLLGLPAANGVGSLGEHLRDISFGTSRSASGATQVALRRGSLPKPPRADLKKVRKEKKRTKSASGHQKRLKAGLSYGSNAFASAKWGQQPTQARAQHWQTFKPMRTRLRKRPARSPA